MTNKEIVQALRCSATKEEQKSCDMCQRSKRGCFECINSYLYEAASLIEQMTAEIAALREKQLWQPVLAGNPEREGCYIVAVHNWLDGKPVVREAFWNGADWLSYDRRHEITPRVTHWMPLPTLPKGDAK